MKTKTQRILSLLLTLAMALSLLAVLPVTASATTTETTNRNGDPVTIITENFDGYENGATYTGGDDFTVKKVNGEDATITVENGALKFTVPSGTANTNYLVYPKSFENDTWMVTGRVKFVGAASSYYGFYFSTTPTYDQNQVRVQADTSANPAYMNAYVNGSLLSGSARYSLDTWLRFEIIREGQTLKATLWKDGGFRLASGSVINTTLPESVGVANPGFRLLNYGTTKGQSVYLDDLTFTTEITTEWAGAHADFENEALGAPTLTNSFLTQKDGKLTYLNVVSEDGNKYLKYAPTAGDSIQMAFEDLRGYETYEITADFKFTGDTATGESDAGDIYFYILAQTSGFDGYRAFWLENAYDKKGVADTAGSNAGTDRFTTGEWWTMAVTRVDKSFTLTVWEKGTARPLTPTVSITLRDDMATGVAPTFRFRCGQNKNASTNLSVGLDNINIVRGAEALNAVKIGGYQGGTVADGKYAVRFIAGLDSRAYSNAKFTVTATYNGGASQKVFVTPTPTCTVYDSIIANTERGIVTYDASSLGANYLAALNIYDIPTSAGPITFHVCFTATKPNGATVTALAQVTLTVTDGVVTPVA